MSYCRSGDDSDVYVWHDCSGGWRIAVAHHRIAGINPNPDPKDIFSQYITKPIGLGRDGDYIVCRTRKKVEQELLALKKVGYRVPSYALKRLREEMRATARRGA